jgi:RNA polymerase sigma-70 factor, ECF subfamily
MSDRRLPRALRIAGDRDASYAKPGKVRVVRPLATEDEVVLVQRSQSGDRVAFEELVRRHADRLYAVVLRYMGNADEAEEATQEAFLRAWRSIKRFRRQSQFFTWIYRIGLNEAKRGAARRPPAGKITSFEEDPLAEAPDWSEAPELRFSQGELREVLEEAIRSLPPSYRLTVILRDIEGLSTSEAASAMELGEPAFKSRLHRARLAVRRAIDEYFVEER